MNAACQLHFSAFTLLFSFSHRSLKSPGKRQQLLSFRIMMDSIIIRKTIFPEKNIGAVISDILKMLASSDDLSAFQKG